MCHIIDLDFKRNGSSQNVEQKFKDPGTGGPIKIFTKADPVVPSEIHFYLQSDLISNLSLSIPLKQILHIHQTQSDL